MGRVAAVTMVYNEDWFLPIWIRYYSSHFGAENCYVIDHGSDDGSTRNLGGINVVRIPRSPKDNEKRTRFVSRFVTALTEWYDAVLHTDVDEFAVLDPTRGSSLLDYCSKPPHPCVTAIGFDVYHVPDKEAALDPSMPVTLQRSYFRFSSSMCKPVLTTAEINWKPGFHSCNYPVMFDAVYLFHLRYVDLKEGLRRLAMTRSMPWASQDAGAHQRVPDDVFTDMIIRICRQPKIDDETLFPHIDPLQSYLLRVLQSENSNASYRIDLHIFGTELWRIPDRFKGMF
jgi:hypothetical protein